VRTAVSESARTTSGDGANRPPSKPSSEKRGFFGRIALFVRQVVAELKKVVRPTRQELFTYIGVVVVFVLVVMAYVGVLDLAFGRLVLWAFG
jgi:preprotein translocase subunit SecE